MDLDAQKGKKPVFNRLGGGGGGGGGNPRSQKVCYHWRQGKCDRFPCPYLHRELPAPIANGEGGGGGASKRAFANDSGFQGPPAARRSHNYNNSHAPSWGRVGGNNNSNNSRIFRKTEKLCHFWAQGSCSFGEKCRYLHSWNLGDGFKLLTQLEGHQKHVIGIALPSGSDKLYTASQDETVMIWDCASGQCIHVANLGGVVGCLISEGPWVFVGLPNLVKALNTQTNADLSLTGPVGQVYSLVVGNDLLFAGAQDGAILAWKFNATTYNFEPAASLKGHSLAVLSLVVGANKLYSGSMDHSIRVWSLETLQCVQTLTEHTSLVMSLLCWNQFLLSCSMDQTIKVWAATAENGNLEVTYTHNEEHGVLALCGMGDLEGKPVLLCSCNDNTVHLYDLPSFSERGKIFAKQEIRAIHASPGGLFFTGDGTGLVRVWNCVPESTATA